MKHSQMKQPPGLLKLLVLFSLPYAHGGSPSIGGGGNITSFVVGSAACTTPASFSVSFADLWTSARHPAEYPSSAHFSPPVAAAHNSNYTMWANHLLASNGVKVVAETGSTSPLLLELQSMNSDCSFSSSSSPSSPIELQVNESCPLLSYITMIAPSPDWFTGFYNLELCHEGQWVDSMTIEAQPWDAGTDCGATYTSANCVEAPALPISEILPNNTRGLFVLNGGILPVAAIIVSRMFSNVADPTTSPTQNPTMVSMGGGSVVSQTVGTDACGTPAEYTIAFTDTWSAERHPLDYPSRNPHFSPPVAASHSSAYTMWESGALASEGVRIVAEVGATSIIFSELAASNSQCSFASRSPSSPITVTANSSCTKLSYITMIAPSPDWFTGFYNLNLCVDGKWLDSLTIETQPWDLGTDCGVTYTSADCAENPRMPISEITSANNARGVFVLNGGVLPVATFVISKPSSSPANTEAANTEEDENNGSLSTGAAVGVGLAVAFVAVGMLGFACWYRKRSSKRPQQATSSKSDGLIA
uniref:Spondin domain-containing protein n=1 Tax=Lotharella oceanica TaxID=641309 RepID=A0A7S2X5L5_9EUKA|mmetsp:Transcript_10101/g.19369  ORF Transcript_10101/g.19369 Transcript_10101/m.19369 type:complete len:532 (+) Transcript_10101:1-1596(+)